MGKQEIFTQKYQCTFLDFIAFIWKKYWIIAINLCTGFSRMVFHENMIFRALFGEDTDIKFETNFLLIDHNQKKITT